MTPCWICSGGLPIATGKMWSAPDPKRTSADDRSEICQMDTAKTRIMYIEGKAGSLNGLARVGQLAHL